MSMPIKIERELTIDARAFVTKMQKYAARRNFELSGDEKAGQFGARGIVGNYSIVSENGGDTLIVEITKKPIMVPGSLIKSKASERLEKWDS